MKRLLLSLGLSLALVMSASAAQAGGGYKGYKGYGYGYKGYGSYNSDAALIAVGIVAGAAILGTLLQPRTYSPPPRVVYVQPQPRATTCVKDQVYRILPDGRKQYGVRTRCY